MLSLKTQRQSKDEIYLNFNHRPTRIIILNLLLFIWSLSNVIFYANVISDSPTTTPIFSHSTYNLLLTYNVIISIASAITLLTLYYQLKVRDMHNLNLSFSISGDLIQIQLINIINLMIGSLYFLSFLLHLIITWKECQDLCTEIGCYLSLLSSTLFCIVFPLILAADIVDNYLRNPNKRILLFVLCIFLSSFIYIFEFQTHDFGKNIYYLPSYIRFSQTSFWLICVVTAVLWIINGFDHTGPLKHICEKIISFILLCSPMIAFNAHCIDIQNGVSISHQSWFLIVCVSIFIAYDLQRLHSFNANVIGAQSTYKEQLITSPPSDFGINTPTKQRRNKSEDEIDKILVFKHFCFKLDYKKQRILIFSIFLLIYAMSELFYFFNFWINFDTPSFDALKAIHPSDFSMHLKARTYALFCISFACIVIVCVAVIFMEWFVIKREERRNKVYEISGGALYFYLGILQLIAVVFGSSDYCKYLDRTFDENGENYYCHMQFVGVHLLSILMPLVLLSIDMMGCVMIFFGNVRVRVLSMHFIVALSSLLWYIGYTKYWNEDELSEYTRFRMSGLLMIVCSFLFEAILSPLFLYLQSNAFAKISNFISSVLIVIGIAVVLDVSNLNINIAEWTLFLPICCLVAYEIQLLT